MKRECAAMANENCTFCSEKCHWTLHKNMDFRFEVKFVTETIEIEDLKKQFLDSNSEKTSTMQIINGLQKEIVKISRKILGMVETLRESINRLNEIALKAGCLDS